MTQNRLMKIECGYCDGTGKVPNPYFEICREGGHPGFLRGCPTCMRISPSDYRDCSRGEIIPCKICGGKGSITVYGRVVAVEPTPEDAE